MIPGDGKLSSEHQSLLKGYNMLLYFCGSLIMYEPTEECIMDFFSDGILKRMPVSSSNQNFMRAAALLRESCKDKEVCRAELVKDHRRLFSDSGLRLANPLESAYRTDQPVNHAARKAGEFYDSYGWNSPPRHNAPDDHLGIEILFLTKLIDKYLQLDDEPCCIEMRKEINRFIGHHIISWLPEWNRKVQENSLSEYYKGVGSLVIACVEDLMGIFDYQGRVL